MSDTIIRVENLGKKYLIKHQQQGNYTALRDVITDKVKSLGKKIISPWNHKQSSTYSTTEEFWALKDISFKVKQGEVIGIIGRNGAGKSTLLKILSRITEPTTGRIRINGRVASLLEVGTGFHPELTGRENIFLNGAILGMGKAEIKRKFDEIVAFAEIEKFLDTPVKRYSSGMYVRLAFAVAAHLEPEILLVDEVLAVGDVAFQKKCLGKMEDVSREGRTVLFVSHNMAAVQNLCPTSIWIEDGVVKGYGNTVGIIDKYLSTSIVISGDKRKSRNLEIIKRIGNIEPIFIEGSLNSNPLVGKHIVKPRTVCQFRFVLKIPEFMPQCTVGIHFETDLGVRIYGENTRWILNRVDLKKGLYRIKCIISELPLVPNRYFLSFGFSSNNKQIDWLSRVTCLEISSMDVYGTGELPWQGQGYFLSNADWNIEKNSEDKY